MKEHGTVLIGSLILFVVVFVAHVDLAFGFVGSGIVGTLLLASAITVLFVFVVAMIRKQRKLMIQCSIVAISFFVAIIASSEINRIKRERSQQIASDISMALEEFNDDKGTYPGSLNELPPVYLKEIPIPQVGFFNKQQFHYKQSYDQEQYILWFPIAAWMFSRYDSELGKWVVDE